MSMNELRKQVLVQKIALVNVLLQKAWSDEARQASIEARRKQGEHEKKAQARYKAAGSTRFSPHTSVGNDHAAAAGNYEVAARHFDNGKMKEGKEAMTRGDNQAKATMDAARHYGVEHIKSKK